jgi:hypothetical protein
MAQAAAALRLCAIAQTDPAAASNVDYGYSGSAGTGGKRNPTAKERVS